MNHRLSPNPENPTPDDPATWVKHPDHLSDVCSALDHVYGEYSMELSLGCILVSASAGATIAFQAAGAFTTPSSLLPAPAIPAPLAVAVFDGVYNIHLFSKT